MPRPCSEQIRISAGGTEALGFLESSPGKSSVQPSEKQWQRVTGHGGAGVFPATNTSYVILDESLNTSELQLSS